MRRLGIVTALVAVVSCGNVVLGDGTTTTSTSGPSTTSTIPTSTTTTARPLPVGGHLVKYDISSLEPEPGLEPIPMGVNSWALTSEDGEWMLILEYVGETVREMTAVDVADWEVVGTFEGVRPSARLIDDGILYMYDGENGEVSSLDLRSGQQSHLGDWPPGLWTWDELHVSSDGRLLALGSNAGGTSPAPYSLLWLDPVSGESGGIEIGPIERSNTDTGVFDGDYEVPESDIPGVVWGDGRLLIAHADGPEVTVVDLATGEVATHLMDSTTWLDRLHAFWVPTATAGGFPSLGTYSSATLSPDGRFLFISGNRYDVSEGPDGSLVEESTHLGLTVIDTEFWRVVDQPDLPFSFVHKSSGVIFGVGTRTTSPWIDDIYTLSVDDSGVVSHTGPFTVEGGGCQALIDGSHLVCSEFTAATQTLRVVDMATGEITAGLDVGQEDLLYENGVLQDWSPSLGSS